MAKDRKFLEGVRHGRSCYNAGCDCAVGRRANSEYLKDWRARKRAEQLAADGVDVPVDEPPADEPPAEQAPEPDDPAIMGPIEKALAADIAGDGDGEPAYLEAVALTVARALDGVARIRRHDLVSPLAQRLVDVGTRLFPPAPVSGGDDDSKRGELLQLIEGGADDEPEAAAGGG